MQDKLNRHLHFLTQDPSNVNLLLEVSQLYQDSNDFSLAQTYLDKAKALAPEACLGHQGLLFLNQNQIDLAEDCFLKALDQEASPALQFYLAYCYFLTQDFEKAQAVLAPLTEEDSIPEAKILLARLLHRQGQLENALACAKKVIDHFPNHEEATGLLALLYFDLNEELMAHQMAKSALSLNPNNYDAQLVDILMRLLTQETEVAEIEQLLAINPQDSRLWFALGNTHLSQGELQLAEEALEKALVFYPEFYDCLTVLAWCQLLNNQIDKAQSNYQKATVIAKELSDGWSGLSLVHALKEELLEAEELLEKALAINPDCFLAGIAKTIYFNHQQPSKAKEQLTRTLKNTKVPAGEKLALVLEAMEI